MKILKIELQNINSLKSKKPIVIDFENDKFKNTGLYAITGTTGSGKTTILDAITVALYYEIPRFNKSKAKLTDFVSYGADKALSRITFENKNEKFEAHWSIRVKTKNGKKELKKPIEKCVLKNISTGKIISSKKNETKAKIEEIIQLNYNQFLRSVMLAQGEFAAFLSANNNDKSKLLEQITGNDVYKKIGEETHKRFVEEQIKLNKIKNKIDNSDNLLSEEKLNEITEEQKIINTDIKKLDNEIIISEEIISWHKKENELNDKKIENKKDFQNLEIEKNDKKIFIEKLNVNEKAEEFKELIFEISKNEKEILHKNAKHKIINEELIFVKNENLENENKLEISKKEFSNKKIDFENWLPKLEKVNYLDSEIENIQKNKNNINLKINELSENLKILDEKIIENKKDLKNKRFKREKINRFLSKNENLKEIEKNLISWKNEILFIKNNLKKISDKKNFINNKKINISNNEKNIEIYEKKFFQKNDEIFKLNEEILKIIQIIEKNNFENLISEKDFLNKNKISLNKILILSKNYKEFLLKNKNLKIEKNKFLIKKDEIFEDLKNFILKIKESKKSLEDIEKIFELELKIKNLEKERKNLKKDEACVLCGSKIHPLIEKYEKISISKTEKELENRKNILNDFLKKEKIANKKFTKIETKISINILNLKEVNENIEKTKNEFKKFNYNFEIENQELIENEISEINEKLKNSQKIIKKIQEEQKEKEKKEKVLKLKNQEKNVIENEISRKKERDLNLKKDLENEKNNFENLKIETKKIKENLILELSKYNFEFPKIEKIFIEDLKNKISNFNEVSKKFTKIEDKILKLKFEINNDDNLFVSKTLDLENYKKENERENKKLIENIEKRNLILPEEITFKEKRESLKKLEENAKKIFDKILENFQNTKTEITKKENELKYIQEEKIILFEKIKNSFYKLEKKLSESDFTSKENVKENLLNGSDKKEFSDIKKSLENKEIELKSISNNLEKEIQNHKKKKNFEKNLFETEKEKYEKEKLRKEKFERKGEIKTKLEINRKIKEKNEETVKEILKQEKVFENWHILKNLLGRNIDSFNSYVQRITLKNLIIRANIHMFKLNERYSLEMNENFKEGEELNFMLIDHFQADEKRLVDTSSGGEKFLISLALALGLSDLASKNVKIDSLFIDEGFGTLDNKTLETVISTLGTLQKQGKMIGIISHVENLKERINTQIQVLKKSNGVSEIKII